MANKMSSTEVSVSSSPFIGKLITQCAENVQSSNEVTITAINSGIPSAINLAEMLKHRIPGLHQLNRMEKVPNSNKARILITLSMAAKDTESPGYQPPLPEDQVEAKSFDELKAVPERKPREDLEHRGPRGRGRDRGRDRGRERGGGGRGRGGGRGSGGRFMGRGDSSFGRRRGRGRRGDLRNRGRFGGGRNFRGDRGRGGNLPETEKYVLKPPQPSPKGPDEILVNARVSPIVFIKEALLKLKETGGKVVVKGSGQAIGRAVIVAEEIKSKEVGLHQQNVYTQRIVSHVYTPKEQGLSEVTKERSVIGVEITLSKAAIDTNHYGYQEPLPADKVKNLTIEETRKL